MKPSHRYGFLALVVIDFALGIFLLFWPGMWQEGVHPWAMGSVFYPIQRLGAMWLGRAVLACIAARRRGPWSIALAGAWALDVPGDLLLAWRVSETGPVALWVYLGHAVMCVLVVYWLCRANQKE